MLKWPDVSDYRENIRELDSKESTKLRCAMRELKHHYLIVLDQVNKNKEKILRPKGSNKQGSVFY